MLSGHQGPLLQGRNLVFVCGSSVFVEDSDGDTVSPFLRSLQGSIPIAGVVSALSLQLVHTLLVPCESVVVVERDAGLQDVDEREAPVTDALLIISERWSTSPEKPRATNVAPLASANSTGFTGGAAPYGVVLVTKPASLVGDACPLVNPYT